jgi:hypothetical protein
MGGSESTRGRDQEMAIMYQVARRVRAHPGVDGLGPPVLGERGRAAPVHADSPAPDGGRTRPDDARPATLGTTRGLGRILAAMTRQGYERPRDLERARASADRLLETIRVLSIL